MKNILYLSAIALLAVSTTACNDNKRAKNFNEKTLVDDKALGFIKGAHEASMTEIRAATVAQSKSQNPRIINFAKMMIADHSNMDNEITKLADAKYVNLKAATDTLNPDHQMMITSMSKLTGPAFDKAYMKMMVEDHSKVVDMFKDETNNTNKAVNNMAQKTIPKLIAHLDSAKAINASLK
jgi:putative membrane protein